MKTPKLFNNNKESFLLNKRFIFQHPAEGGEVSAETREKVAKANERYNKTNELLSKADNAAKAIRDINPDLANQILEISKKIQDLRISKKDQNEQQKEQITKAEQAKVDELRNFLMEKNLLKLDRAKLKSNPKLLLKLAHETELILQNENQYKNLWEQKYKIRNLADRLKENINNTEAIDELYNLLESVRPQNQDYIVNSRIAIGQKIQDAISSFQAYKGEKNAKNFAEFIRAFVRDAWENVKQNKYSALDLKDQTFALNYKDIKGNKITGQLVITGLNGYNDLDFTVQTKATNQNKTSEAEINNSL